MAGKSNFVKVGILPHEHRYEVNLGSVPLNFLDWPGQVAPKSGTIADLTVSDHVVVYPSSKRLMRSFGAINCKVDLLMAEPLAIHGKYYRNIWLLRHKFNYILSRYQKYAAKYANVIECSPVESWVDGKSVSWPVVKHLNCSLIASDKTGLIGHKLRHQVVGWIKLNNANVEVIGRGYKPFEFKQDGLLPYYYSVVIENVQEPDYFTEKLLDCMLCGSLPIYYGPKNISDYFNIQGMLCCESLNDFQSAIESTANPPNEIQQAAMIENRQSALLYSNLHQRIVDAIIHKDNE